MATNVATPETAKAQLSGQLSTFYVDDLFFGVDVLHVQEVLRYQEMTPVPQAPDIVEGLINLRGQIVTAIDLRRKLLLSEREGGKEPMNIVVRTTDGAVSLLVDEIGDVLDVEAATYERPPDNLSGSARELIRGVYKLKDQLLLVLDTEKASEACTPQIVRSGSRENVFADAPQGLGWNAAAMNEAYGHELVDAPSLRVALRRGAKKGATTRGNGQSPRATH
jgi:purine-binding chemotaxis protein CheW